MTFSPTDAAFEGFRLTRREPGMIVALGLVYVVLWGVVLAVAHQPMAQLMQLMSQMSTGTEPSEAEAMAFMSAYGQIIAVSVLPSIIVNSIVQCAVMRAIFHPEEKRFGYVRLGKDEVRVTLVNLAVSFLLGAALVLGAGAVGVLIGLGANGMAPLILVGTLMALALLAAVGWLAVRLCLAVPIAFTQKRISLRQSFAVTKGRFWPVVGMLVLALFLSMAVSFLGSIVTTPLTMMTGGLGVLAGDVSLTGGVVAALFVWVVLSAVLGAAQMLIVYAPLAAAWKSLKA